MYKVNEEQCIGCGVCAGECPNDAISIVNDKAVIDENKCMNCGKCADMYVLRARYLRILPPPSLVQDRGWVRVSVLEEAVAWAEAEEPVWEEALA